MTTSPLHSVTREPLRSPTADMWEAVAALEWQTVWESDLSEISMSGGTTMRCYIPASVMTDVAGTKIRLTFRGHSTLTAEIGAIYFGDQSGSDLYDMGTRVAVTVGGSGALNLAANQTVVSDEIDFAFDGSTDKVFSFYGMSGSGGFPAFGYGQATGAIRYTKAGNDASTGDATGYSSGGTGFIFLCTKIEVYG